MSCSKSALDRGAQEYLDALSDLIATYEDEHAPIPDASESDVLRELMRSSGHKQMAAFKSRWDFAVKTLGDSDRRT